MKRIFGSIFAVALLAAPAAYATSHASAKSTQAAASMTEGEVRKVDREQRKLTVKHGEIKSLEMPPMTMVFRVKDAALLENVKEGDKIKFSAEKIEGNMTITKIEAGARQ